MLSVILMPFVLAQSSAPPVVESKVFSTEMQWKALEACPRVEVMNRVQARRVDNIGTGVVVALEKGNGTTGVYLLTAAHVVPEDDQRIELAFFEPKDSASTYRLRDAKVIGRSASVDVALLKVNVAGDERIPPTLKLAAPGQRPKKFPFPVMTVGCSDGLSARCKENQVNARRYVKRENHPGTFFWEAQLPSVQGRSGGPMMDRENRVLGITSAKSEGHGYFAHTDEIHAWLKQLGYEWLWKQE